MRFDRFAMLDWSSGRDTGPRPRKDAIWLGINGEEAKAPQYLRNRQLAEVALADLIDDTLTRGARLFLAVDFTFGYPRGFARAVTGSNDPFALWAYFADRIEDSPKDNNRFDVAGEINRRFGGKGPFWGNPLKRDIAGLARNKKDYDNPFPERRLCEQEAKGAFTCWQLAGAGAVGAQVLTGLPVLHRLRLRFPNQIAVWPFEPLSRPIAVVETWPTLINPAVHAAGGIRDAEQVRLMARAFSALPPETLAQMLAVNAPEEGWIAGLGHEAALLAALDGLN